MRIYPSILLLCLPFSFCLAQYDSLLHKSFVEKRPLLFDFYGKKLKIHDPHFKDKKTIIEGLRQFGEKHDDPSLVREAALAEAWLQALESPAGKLTTGLMKAFIQSSLQSQDYISATRAYRMLGDLNWRHEKYERAFECYLKCLETGRRLADEAYPEKMIDNVSLGSAFYSFKEYDKAIIYLREGLRHKPPGALANIQSDARNTIGLYHQKKGNLDSSDYYFGEILKHPTQRFEEWNAIAKGNMGYNQYLRGHYQAAIPLLEEDIRVATKYHNPEYASKSNIWLAAIYLKLSDLPKAEKMLEQARHLIETKNQFDNKEFLYPVLSQLYSIKGNLRKGQVYLDSALWVKDSVQRKFSTMQLARAQQKLESARANQEILNLESEKENKVIQRNILVVFLIVVLMLVLYIYRLVKHRHEHEQLIKNLELERKEQELLDAEQQLSDFARNIQDKTRMLEDLEAQLQLSGVKDDKLMAQLHQSHILTDDQWVAFRQSFEKVHAGYLARLKENLPDLTPGEIRYMVLAKLKLGHKEMAAVLGISHQTIRVTTHRLRKKLQITEESALSKLIDSI